METANQRSAKVKNRQEWMQVCVPIEEQFTVLPAWAKDVPLDTISNAIQNKIIVINSTQKAVAA